MTLLLLAAAAIPSLDCSADAALKQTGWCAPASGPAREKLPVPGVRLKMDLASATRAPWVDANGWRFERYPGKPYLYVLPPGSAAWAAAGAFAWEADAVLRIDPADLDEYRRMRAFLERIPPAPLPPLANIAVIDDGSDLAGEIMNLLARRNLLFRAVRSAAEGFGLTLRVPTQAVDPAEVAAQARRDLTDDKRLVRLYGTEVVLARLTGDAARRRLHLVNYSRRKVEGLRVRLLGSWPDVTLRIFGIEAARPEDLVTAGGATEFTIPEMSVYALADLRR